MYIVKYFRLSVEGTIVMISWKSEVKQICRMNKNYTIKTTVYKYFEIVITVRKRLT